VSICAAYGYDRIDKRTLVRWLVVSRRRAADFDPQVSNLAPCAPAPMIVVLPLSTIRLFGDPDQDGLCIGVCHVLWRS
jgi:hypothetical protein